MPPLDQVRVLLVARHQRKRARMYFVASARRAGVGDGAAVGDALVGLVGHLDPALLSTRSTSGSVNSLNTVVVGRPLLDLHRAADLQVLRDRRALEQRAHERVQIGAPGGRGWPARGRRTSSCRRGRPRHSRPTLGVERLCRSLTASTGGPARVADVDPADDHRRQPLESAPAPSAPRQQRVDCSPRWAGRRERERPRAA